MKWIIRISLCLLLFSGGGVVTTVGVAWGLAWAHGDSNLTPPYRNFGTEELPIPDDVHVWLWRYAKLQESDCTFVFGRWFDRFGYSAVEIRYLPPDSPMDGTDIRTGGWPMFCLEGALVSDFDFDQAPGPPHLRNFVLFPDDVSEIVGAGMPLRPVWPGFAVNTLFYAGMCFGVFFAWRAHMRVVRRWQGYCPNCKYDLRGKMERGCSECGWKRYS